MSSLTPANPAQTGQPGAGSLLSPLPMVPNIPGFNGYYVAKSIAVYVLENGNHNKALTGGTDFVDIKIGLPHRINRIEIVVKTSAGADPAFSDALTVFLNKIMITPDPTTLTNTENLVRLNNIRGEAAGAIQLIMGEGYESQGARSYRLNFIGTSGDLVYLELYVEYLPTETEATFGRR